MQKASRIQLNEGGEGKTQPPSIFCSRRCDSAPFSRKTLVNVALEGSLSLGRSQVFT